MCRTESSGIGFRMGRQNTKETIKCVLVGDGAVGKTCLLKRFKNEQYDTVGKSDDDVIKAKHFPRYWPFVRGINRSPVNFPQKDQ